jgi:hypothetical protein
MLPDQVAAEARRRVVQQAEQSQADAQDDKEFSQRYLDT